ncbi:MAG: tyrosine-type recombinase/integrase [Bdellovibrionales bacterium]
MAIRERLIDGKLVYEVSINIRSKQYRDLRVQKLKTHIRTLKEAQLIERNLLKECSAELTRREGSAVTWAELQEEWELAHRRGQIGLREIQANTLQEMLSFIRRWTSEWNNKGCHEIRPGEVRKIMNIMEEQGYSRSRLRTLKSSVNVLFRWGIDEGLIRAVHSSPAIGVEILKAKDEKPPLILSLAEIHKLLEAAKSMDHEWYPVWAMALNTGMRSGELYALEWKDIDWDNKLITVSKSYNGRLKQVKGTKAGYWRKVPFNSDTEGLLKELRAKACGDHVLPRIGMWRRGEAAKVLREFCVGIGINSVSFHALRACFATHLLNSGVTSPVVKKICGWTDEKVMTRYIRLAGIDVSGATDKLNFIRNTEVSPKLVNLHSYRTNKGDNINE